MVSDTVTAELHNSSSPYALVESKKGVLNTAGVGTFNFATVVNGTPYYIVVKHRNAIETWSSAGNSFTFGLLSYDFTSSQSQAYGSNLVLKDGKYCICSGDINHDNNVNLLDLIEVDNDNTNIVNGYINTDVNGDNNVNLLDLIIVDNNNTAIIKRVAPTGALVSKSVKQ
jgi:hypothetical protein